MASEMRETTQTSTYEEGSMDVQFRRWNRVGAPGMKVPEGLPILETRLNICRGQNDRKQNVYWVPYGGSDGRYSFDKVFRVFETGVCEDKTRMVIPAGELDELIDAIAIAFLDRPSSYPAIEDILSIGRRNDQINRLGKAFLTPIPFIRAGHEFLDGNLIPGLGAGGSIPVKVIGSATSCFDLDGYFRAMAYPYQLERRRPDMRTRPDLSRALTEGELHRYYPYQLVSDALEQYGAINTYTLLLSSISKSDAPTSPGLTYYLFLAQKLGVTGSSVLSLFPKLGGILHAACMVRATKVDFIEPFSQFHPLLQDTIDLLHEKVPQVEIYGLDGDPRILAACSAKERSGSNFAKLARVYHLVMLELPLPMVEHFKVAAPDPRYDHSPAEYNEIDIGKWIPSILIPCLAAAVSKVAVDGYLAMPMKPIVYDSVIPIGLSEAKMRPSEARSIAEGMSSTEGRAIGPSEARMRKHLPKLVPPCLRCSTKCRCRGGVTHTFPLLDGEKESGTYDLPADVMKLLSAKGLTYCGSFAYTEDSPAKCGGSSPLVTHIWKRERKVASTSTSTLTSIPADR